MCENLGRGGLGAHPPPLPHSANAHDYSISYFGRSTFILGKLRNICTNIYSTYSFKE